MAKRLVGLLLCLLSVGAVPEGQSQAPVPDTKRKELYIVGQIIDATALDIISGPFIRSSDLRPGRGLSTFQGWGNSNGTGPPIRSVSLSVRLGKEGVVEVYGCLRHDDGREEGCARTLKLEEGSRCLFRLPAAGETKFLFSAAILSPDPLGPNPAVPGKPS